MSVPILALLVWKIMVRVQLSETDLIELLADQCSIAPLHIAGRRKIKR